LYAVGVHRTEYEFGYAVSHALIAQFMVEVNIDVNVNLPGLDTYHSDKVVGVLGGECEGDREAAELVKVRQIVKRQNPISFFGDLEVRASVS
jgi:hypothetical protein